MMPNTKQHVTFKQVDQKQHHDKRDSIFPGTTVFVREYNGKNKWVPGVILQGLGPVTFSVAINNGRTMNCHIDQLRYRTETVDASDVTPSDSVDTDIALTLIHQQRTPPSLKHQQQDTASQVITEPPSRHYPLRQRKP